MPRIVFSIAFFRQKLPVQLVSTSTKSRWKFYTQVRRGSFHTAWTHSGLSYCRKYQPRKAGFCERVFQLEFPCFQERLIPSRDLEIVGQTDGLIRVDLPLAIVGSQLLAHVDRKAG